MTHVIADRVRETTTTTGTGAITPVELAGDYRALGLSRWRRAVNLWARCLREDRWPGYTEGITTIAAPEWAMAAEPTPASFEKAARWKPPALLAWALGWAAVSANLAIRR